MAAQVCCVPGCSNRSDRDKHVSFHRLPLKRKTTLKKWILKLGKKNLQLNEKTRICSEHFIDSRGRQLREDEVPSLKLPVISRSKRTVVSHAEEEDSDSDTACTEQEIAAQSTSSDNMGEFRYLNS